MPFIQIKVFENELNQEQSCELIEKMTDAVTAVTSEKLRDATWVIIEEIKDGHWGIGAKPICLEDVKNMISDN